MTPGSVHETIIKETLKRKITSQDDLYSIKKRMAKFFNGPLVTNTELLQVYRNLLKTKNIKESRLLEKLLRIKGTRSLSGIAVVSVLTKPYPCPGQCLYCPTQKGIPKSYLDNEPAVMRAVLNKFDPYSQVKMRLQALRNIGHPIDKIELIVIGGTWSYLPKNYQTHFIKRCFDACNNKNSKTLKRAQKLNERAKNRIIGLTLETRPDFVNEKEIKRMRWLGATRIEIGVQSIYNDVLDLNRRGHGIETTIKATKLLKDAGFKVCYHMMPNLPGSNPKRDERMLEELFSNQDFQPDLLKIYPCAILKEAPLYRLWKRGKYQPYKDKELINLLKTIKSKVPYYCRIQRLIRDIPSQSIITGPTKAYSNLRQILADNSKKEGWKCNCIRCREVKDNYKPKDELILFRQDYDASRGKEIFLSFESACGSLTSTSSAGRKLYALLRLRIPSFAPASPRLCRANQDKHFIPVLQNTAIIREVHTYGQLVPISDKQKVAAQHKGLGKKLMKEAEKIAKKEFGLNKMAVISGVGVRGYYRRLGYKLKDTYMVRKI